MTFEEACVEAVSGRDMTAAHLQPGCCLTSEFGPNVGFRRTWPNGDGCTFIPNEADEAADWFEYVPPVKVDAWGKPKTDSRFTVLKADELPKPGQSVEDAIAAALAAKKARNEAEDDAKKLAIAQAPQPDDGKSLAAWGARLRDDPAPAAAPVQRDAWGRPIG
jgi:hypothetical protein